MASIQWPWAILLCRYSDKPNETRPPEYYRDLYTRNGSGGLADYWRAVSHNAIDISGSQVFGWFEMSHASAEVSQLHFPTDRGRLVAWGIEAAQANGVDLRPFRSILVVHNWGVDHGAAFNGVVIVHQDPNLCEFGFISHEMGHGFGLPHSNASNPDMVYGDGWDVMSFATTTFQFPIEFQGSSGQATVGVNARNLLALGAVPPGRLWQAAAPDFSSTVVLDPLNQPPIGNHGALVIQVLPGSTRPARANGSSYTVEFRCKAGWDRGIPENAVVVHEVRGDSLSYLYPGLWGRYLAGQQFALPDPAVWFRVVSIDSAGASATLRLWDLPEGCLRKEDSKPPVYLIRNGQKCWIPSPAVLSGIGKTWADVRVVPDGALAAIPVGPDVTLPPRLDVAVAPMPPDVNRPVGFTVTARDASSGALVAGTVTVGRTVVGATNTPLVATFRAQRKRVGGVWVQTYPAGVVKAAGYPDASIDFGWPDV